MNNRFVRAIRSGEIGSIADLKVEFKRLAMLTHPDVLRAEGAAEDFIRVRSEYERALDGFERFRFGSGAEAARGDYDRRSFYASLVALFKRGFPKSPRHEKERLRYEYARYLALGQARAWAQGRGALFESFESALLRAKTRSVKAYNAVLDLVLAIFEYHDKGGKLFREGIRLQHSILLHGERPEDAICEFIALLVGDLDLGPAFRGAEKSERT